jgi:hypothetical protein
VADFPTRLDLYQIGRSYLLARAKGIDPATVDVAGSDANLFVGSQSFVAHAVVRQLQSRFAAHFIGSAQGEDLDRKLWDMYRLPRKGAAAAVGGGRFYRLTLDAGAGTVDVGTVVATGTSSTAGPAVQYVTTTTATFGASDYEATCDVRATNAGKEYQVGANQLRVIPQVGSLFDPSLQFTNDDPTAGGEPREDDPTYAERGQDFWPSARRGTLSAIPFGAKTVAGIASATAVEALDGTGRPARVVDLYIGDSSGVASRALGAEVDAALLEYRAAGIAVVTSLSVPTIVPVQLRLAFAAGVVTAPLTELVRAAVLGYVNSTPTGGTLYRNGIGTVLSRYARAGLLPNNSTVVEPAGDVVPSPGQTIRTTLDQVTTV